MDMDELGFFLFMDEQERKKREKEDTPPPIFWKYYDLYRRKQISISEFSEYSGLLVDDLFLYLKSVQHNAKNG